MATVYRLIDAQERRYIKAHDKQHWHKVTNSLVNDLKRDAHNALDRARREGERTSMPKLERTVDLYVRIVAEYTKTK